VVEGSTENKAVVRHLITGLRDRGLDASEVLIPAISYVQSGDFVRVVGGRLAADAELVSP
jgi:hypothetical protein